MKTKDPDIKSGKWSLVEDKRLAIGVSIFGEKWADVAQFVPQRTDIQCRERYCNVLHPSLNNNAWTNIEDCRLIIAVTILGRGWSRIARVVESRTDNQCWRRFKSLRNQRGLLRIFGVLEFVDMKVI